MLLMLTKTTLFTAWRSLWKLATRIRRKLFFFFRGRLSYSSFFFKIWLYILFFDLFFDRSFYFHRSIFKHLMALVFLLLNFIFNASNGFFIEKRMS
jgi:hypothetical protein